MAGEISAANLFNPYANYLNNNGTLNDDFMYNAMMNAQTQNKTASTPSFQGHQQPSADTFESSGDSGLSTGLKLGTAAGALTGAGFYFVDNSKVVPFADNRFNDEILKSLEGDHTEAIGKEVQKAVNVKKLEIMQKNGIGGKVHLAQLEVAAENGNPAAIKKLEELQKAFDEGIKEADIIKEQTEKYLKNNTIDGAKGHLAQMHSRQSLINGLAEDAKAADIEKLIKENPKAFGITATEEAEIEKEVAKIAKKYGANRTSATAFATNEVTAAENTLTKVRDGINGKYSQYWNTEAKTLAEGAPQNLTKAVNKFKFAKAGKYGLLAAGVGLALGWLFGGKS